MSHLGRIWDNVKAGLQSEVSPAIPIWGTESKAEMRVISDILEWSIKDGDVEQGSGLASHAWPLGVIPEGWVPCIVEWVKFQTINPKQKMAGQN